MGVFECKMSKYSILISFRDLSRTHNSIRILAFGCCRNAFRGFSLADLFSVSLFDDALRFDFYSPESLNRNPSGTLGFIAKKSTTFNRKRSGSLGLNTEYSRPIRELWFHNRQVFAIPCIRYSHSSRELWFHNRHAFSIHISPCSDGSQVAFEYTILEPNYTDVKSETFGIIRVVCEYRSRDFWFRIHCSNLLASVFSIRILISILKVFEYKRIDS